MIEKFDFFNIKILSITRQELLENLKEGVLYTPNVDHLIKLQKDREFYEAYLLAEWVICDSKILYLSSLLLKRKIAEPIPGSSFFQSFYTHHKNNPDCKIFLLGAAEGVAQKAATKINEKMGRKIVVGYHSPSFGFEQDEDECRKILEIVNRSGANVLVVGVGAPKQEKWIAKYRSLLPQVKLFMALGATIDFEAGTLKRAPQIWQSLSLEWLYRVFQEPKRLFKRYFVDDIKYLPLFFDFLTNKYKNPF